MRIITLIENTPGGNACCHAEHGLSFYIETKKHKVLVDTGQSEKTLENAAALGVDLSDVDTVVLSHGHYDHTGGVIGFSRINNKARYYMHKKAILDYTSLREMGDEYIGIDKDILKLSSLRLIDENVRLDDELYIFSGVDGRMLWPAGNGTLHRREPDGSIVQDVFDHEQYLVISQDGKNYLISGCAHNGILNILERYREIFHMNPDVVISGFHMMNKKGYSAQDITDIKATARLLTGMDTKFYTGHCTGDEAFEIMKEIMGDRLARFHSGDEIFVE